MTGTRRQDIMELLQALQRQLVAEFAAKDRFQPPVVKELKTEQELRDRIEELEYLLGVRLPVVDMNRKRLRLTRSEACLLAMLITSPSKVLSRDFIHQAIYGARPEVDKPEPDIIDQYIVTLRKKLRLFGLTIETQWGDGWYITAETAERLRQKLRE